MMLAEIILLVKPLMLWYYLVSTIPLPLILLVEKFLQISLLADLPAVKNDSLCLQKFIEKFC